MFENESCFFIKTKHCSQILFPVTQVFRQTHEWLTAMDISDLLSLQKTLPFMSLTSQNQQTELSSWPVRADFLISHYRLLYIYEYFTKHTIFPLQTGKTCLWMTRLPTKCCGFLTAAPKFVEELRRFVLSWTGQRDTNTLHRCVTRICI